MDQNNQSFNNWNAWDDEPRPVPQKKQSAISLGGIIAIALVCALVGGIVGAGGMYLFSGLVSKDDSAGPDTSVVLQGEREQTLLDTLSIPTGELMTQAQVYAANVNSTVGITTSVTTNFWGYQTTAAATGSGFILTADGYILTNYHVIENSTSISVALYNGTSYDAELIGYDISNDIAVLKVDATGLTPVIIGDSDNMNVGDGVVAIGNPLGELTFTLTAGTVSAMDREITMSTGTTMNLIQTDCAINSGNSGGALFNLYGEVVGITNAKYSGNSASGASIDNIAFAIPINDVWGIIQSIIEDGYIAKPYVGLSVVDVSKETQLYGLPQGAAIRAVTEDSPAEAAGLQVSDIITAIDDTAITGSRDLVRYISNCAVGDELVLTVYRQGGTIQVNLTVGEKIQSAKALEEQVQQRIGQGSLPSGN